MKRSTKERIFRQVAENYSSEFGGSPRLSCPLCLRSEFLTVDDPRLTWDHVPPDSIGGTLRVPVCDDCNHRAGSDFEDHLARYKRRADFALAYPDAVPLLFKWGGIVHRVAVRNDGDNVQVIGREDLTQDAASGAATRQFERVVEEANWQEQTFSLSTDLDFEASGRCLNLSLLKAGYLAVFATFGYKVIKGDAYELIRLQIRSPFEDVAPLAIGLTVRKEEGKAKTIDLGILMEPSPFQALVVGFFGFETVHLTGDTFQAADAVVTLPWPGDSFERYRAATQHVSTPGSYKAVPIQTRGPFRFAESAQHEVK